MKALKILLTLFFISSLFYSCNRDEDEKQTVELSGTWKFAKIKMNEKDQWQTWSEDEAPYYKLRADYKFETGLKIGEKIYTAEVGKWTLNSAKDEFTLDFNGSSLEDYSLKILEKNGNEITLKNSNDWYELWVKQ